MFELWSNNQAPWLSEPGATPRILDALERYILIGRGRLKEAVLATLSPEISSRRPHSYWASYDRRVSYGVPQYSLRSR